MKLFMVVTTTQDEVRHTLLWGDTPEEVTKFVEVRAHLRVEKTLKRIRETFKTEEQQEILDYTVHSDALRSIRVEEVSTTGPGPVWVHTHYFN